MQVTRPNVTKRTGVRLHPKACAPLGLEAERATPKHLGTQSTKTWPLACIGNGIRHEVR